MQKDIAYLMEISRVKNLAAGTGIQTCDLLTCGVLTLTLSTEFDLLLCQPMFGPFQVASTLGDLAVVAIATVSVASKQTQSLCILKE